MKFRNKGLLAKILLLVVILLVGGLTIMGCVKGLQPIGWSGGTVADGTLFVGSKEGRLVAINTADGGRQWSEPLKSSGTAGGFGCAPALGGGCAGAAAGVAIYGTPIVSGELVYIAGYNGKVYAFNSSSLQMRWVYPREDYLSPIIGGLTMALDKVYFGTSGGKVYALDAATGDEVWEFQTGDESWSTPAVDGNMLFITSFDKKLYALDAADGSKRWELETEGAIASTPLVHNNTVYVGSFDRHLYAVDAVTGRQIWRFPVTDEGESNPENWFWAKPIVYNNIIYAGCLDGKVYALNAEGGGKLAEFDLGSPVSSSPVLVDSSIIFASQQGVIYALDTGSHELRLLADIEQEIYGPLCASDGIVYIHTQDLTLHPVNAETGAKLATISLKSSE